MKTRLTVDQQRKADRAKRLAAMTERDLVNYLNQIADELNDNRMDYRLKLNHYEIRDAIRAELAARRQPVQIAA